MHLFRTRYIKKDMNNIFLRINITELMKSTNNQQFVWTAIKKNVWKRPKENIYVYYASFSIVFHRNYCDSKILFWFFILSLWLVSFSSNPNFFKFMDIRASYTYQHRHSACDSFPFTYASFLFCFWWYS